MPISAINLQLLKEEPQAELVKEKQISYKANSTNSLERNPQNDSFNKNNTGKTIGTIAGVLALATAVVLGVCYHKGKPAEGVEKKLGERIKDGWKKLWGKGNKPVEIKPSEESTVKPELTMNEDAKKAYDDITKMTEQNFRLSVNDKKPQVLKDMAKYYRDMENAKTIDEFLAIGKFEDGKAILNNGKKYNGYIKRVGPDGKYTALQKYKNGVLSESEVTRGDKINIIRYDSNGRIVEKNRYFTGRKTPYVFDYQRRYHVSDDGTAICEEYIAESIDKLPETPNFITKRYKSGDKSVREDVNTFIGYTKIRTRANDGSYAEELVHNGKSKSGLTQYDSSGMFIAKYSKDLKTGELEKLNPYHEVYKDADGNIKYEKIFNANSAKQNKVVVHNADGSIAYYGEVLPEGKIKSGIHFGEHARLNGENKLIIEYPNPEALSGFDPWEIYKSADGDLIFNSKAYGSGNNFNFIYDPKTKAIKDSNYYKPSKQEHAKKEAEYLISEFERICPGGNIQELWQEKSKALAKCVTERPDTALLKEELPFDFSEIVYW